jgi:hypothetical protein
MVACWVRDRDFGIETADMLVRGAGGQATGARTKIRITGLKAPACLFPVQCADSERPGRNQEPRALHRYHRSGCRTRLGYK